MKFHITVPRSRHSHGFALVATVSMMVLLTLVAIAMLSLSTIEQRSSGGGANEADRMARANARMALMMALGELQKAAGPDQRVTATATILGNSANPYASGTTAEMARNTGWGSGIPVDYSPAVPDSKNFMSLAGFLTRPKRCRCTGGMPDQHLATDDMVIFEGADAACTASKVPKVEVATPHLAQVLLRLLGGGRGGEGGPGVERGSFTRCERAGGTSSASRGRITGFLVGPLPVA